MRSLSYLATGSALLSWRLYVVIVSRVFRASEITVEIIVGAVCVYVIIGAAWAFLYFFLQVMAPGSMMALPLDTRGSAVPPALELYRFWEMHLLQHVRHKHYGIPEYRAAYATGPPAGSDRGNHRPIVCSRADRANRGA